MNNPFENAGADPFIERAPLRDNYVPDEIVNRDDHIDELVEALLPALNGYHPNHVFASGPPGTGKNVCTSFILDNLREQVSKQNTLRALNTAVREHLEQECSSGALADEYDSANDLLDAYEGAPRDLLRAYREATGESLVNGLASSFPEDRAASQEELIVDALDGDFQETPVDLTVEWVKCRGVSTGYQLAVRITNALRSPEEDDLKSTGHANQRVYDKMAAQIEQVGEPDSPDSQGVVILVLDEMEDVEDLDTLFYKFSRAGTKGSHLNEVKIGTICLSNHTNFRDQFSARTESSLHARYIDFIAYEAYQLQDILESRAGEAVREEALEDGVLPLCAALAASHGGDARFALRLLLHAGTKATKENSPVVTESHVREAKTKLEQERMQSMVSRYQNSRVQGLLALCHLQDDQEARFETTTVYEHYKKLCAAGGVEPVGRRHYHKFLTGFANDGVVERYEGSAANESHRWSLSYPSEKIIEGIDSDTVSAFLGEVRAADSGGDESGVAGTD